MSGLFVYAKLLPRLAVLCAEQLGLLALYGYAKSGISIKVILRPAPTSICSALVAFLGFFSLFSQ
jgi:hypothetical protein